MSKNNKLLTSTVLCKFWKTSLLAIVICVLIPKKHDNINIFSTQQPIISDLMVALSGFTHLGRATHICVGNLTTIGSDNGLPPGRRQAII